jgi:hypothetical protein
MTRRLSVMLMALALIVVCGKLATSAAPQEKVDKQKCLGCHGPYDTLKQKTANYSPNEGEKASPHQYVPHEEKKEIPECTECHTPHKVPLEDKATVVKAKGVDYCYTNCHHARNLQPCKDCH